jgi:hypothetical protein
VPLTQFRLVLSLSTLFMGTIMPRPRSKACIDIREADEVLKNLFFAGEKPPPLCGEQSLGRDSLRRLMHT